MTPRILVTGSRHWTDRSAISYALLDALTYLRTDTAVVVHGAAQGADTEADLAARALGLEVERHPAQWDRYGRKAGPQRNIAMVAAGADLCLAFPLDGSVGTWHCLRTAVACGIQVRIYPPLPAEAGPVDRSTT